MKSFVRRYAEFLRQPDVARMMAVALLSRMPIGMVGFAMLMFLREHLGSFALAGTAVGIHFVAIAVSAPIQGRLIDRLGPRLPLMVTGLLHPLAHGAVLALTLLGLPFAAIAVATALAGLFVTPITVLTRTVWRHRFEREDDRRTAFALDSVLIEINFTLGPALMAVVLAGFGSTAAYALGICVIVASFLVYATSPILRYFKAGPAAERHMLGPLAQPRLLLLFVATFGLTTAFGLLEVGYPGYATHLAAPALAGVLLALNAMGSAVGGAIFGGLHLRVPLERQYAWAMAIMVVPLALHVPFAGYPIAFGVLAFAAGSLIAPAIASQSVLVSRLAPAQYATEAFTWSSTFIVSGLGAGMALGGWLIESAGIRTPFGIAAAIVAAMALLAYLQLSPSPQAAPRAAE
jgi:predicted MFS family arabinose efflux permease